MSLFSGLIEAEVPLLAGLDEAQRGELAALLGTERFRDDALILKEGAPIRKKDPAWYLVLSGQVLVERRESGLLRVLLPGESFGHLAILDGTTRGASCRAGLPVVLARLDLDVLERLRAERPSLAARLDLGVARQLARDLRLTGELLRATSRAPAPPSAATERVTLASFTGLQRASAELHHPGTPAELAALFQRARRERRRVVLVGGGVSFDGQAVGDDLAVSLSAFDQLVIDPHSGHYSAGAGVTWRTICERLQPMGWVPPVVISTGAATVGGTVSSNSLSRFTPIWGKEGKSVVSIELMTPDGELHRASRTESPELFYAAVGGFGGVGAILSATYAARKVPTPTAVRSTVQRHQRYAGLPALMGPAALTADRSAYGVFSIGEGSLRGLILQSEYCGGAAPRPMLPHKVGSPLRVPLEMAVNRWHALSGMFWAFTHDVYMRATDDEPFVDDLLGYTFFMDGHLRAKRAADRLGVQFHILQQTFVVPRDEDLEPFLERCVARLHGDGLPIALLDILWVPRDEPFCLSSSRDSGGYAVTFSFEGPVPLPPLATALRDLAGEVEAVGGRIHLVKNVFATPEMLARTYAGGLADYTAVKRRVDPEGILRSEFLQRCFPGLYA